jgi:hypothetical protein
MAMARRLGITSKVLLTGFGNSVAPKSGLFNDVNYFHFHCLRNHHFQIVPKMARIGFIHRTHFVDKKETLFGSRPRRHFERTPRSYSGASLGTVPPNAAAMIACFIA